MSSKKEEALSAEYLRQELDYDPSTGRFSWIKPKSGRKTRYAGCYTKRGYVLICVNRRLYFAHRLAWLHYYGEWPKSIIDHKDGDGQNNAISNLRLATPAQNAINAVSRSTNKSGHRGVSWDAVNSKWRATITIDYVQRSLGRHESLEAAVAAYEAAASGVHPDFRLEASRSS